MSTIGQRICEGRKAKGLTQEALAELSKVNLRTIQRIENNENSPRGSTLNILCEVLQLELESLPATGTSIKSKNLGSLLINTIFLAVLNLAMMSVIGYLTLDTEANLNSRLGALLLSIFMPLMVVVKTQHLSPSTRVLYFGTGFLIYIISATIILGLPEAFVTGLIPSLTIGLATLFYGDRLVKVASA